MEFTTVKRFTPVALVILWAGLIPLFMILMVNSGLVQLIGIGMLAFWLLVWTKCRQLDLLYVNVQRRAKPVVGVVIALTWFAASAYLMWTATSGITFVYLWLCTCLAATLRLVIETTLFGELA